MSLEYLPPQELRLAAEDLPDRCVPHVCVGGGLFLQHPHWPDNENAAAAVCAQQETTPTPPHACTLQLVARAGAAALPFPRGADRLRAASGAGSVCRGWLAGAPARGGPGPPVSAFLAGAAA